MARLTCLFQHLELWITNSLGTDRIQSDWLRRQPHGPADSWLAPQRHISSVRIVGVAWRDASQKSHGGRSIQRKRALRAVGYRSSPRPAAVRSRIFMA